MTRQALLLAVCLGLLPSAISGAEIRGRIASVDQDKNEMRVEGRLRYRGQNLTLTLNEQTRVLFGAEVGELRDLEVGRIARVSYERDKEGNSVAEVVRVSGSPPRPSEGSSGSGKRGERVRGVLRRVALTDRELVVIGPGERGPKTETTIKVPDKTPVRRDGNAIAFEELHENEKVAVEVRVNGETTVAVAVYAGAEIDGTGPNRLETIRTIRRGLQAADFLLGILERMEERK